MNADPIAVRAREIERDARAPKYDLPTNVTRRQARALAEAYGAAGLFPASGGPDDARVPLREVCRSIAQAL